MGIKSIPADISVLTCADLHQLIADQCPNAVKVSEIKNYFGRKVAIVPLPPHALTLTARTRSPHSVPRTNASSMSIYQFMIAVRQQDGQQLMSESGETTRCHSGIWRELTKSHLMGMFYRTLRIIDNGIKPCYVFDGAPPTLKNGEVTSPTTVVPDAG